MNSINTTAGTAGRLLGTAYAHTRRTVELIDWAEVSAIVLHGIVTTAILVYLAGEYTGRTLHRLNDALSRVWVALWVPEPAPVAEPTAEPVQPVLAPPATHPLATLADDLQALSCNQLRQLLGTKRRCSKRELVMLALAF